MNNSDLHRFIDKAVAWLVGGIIVFAFFFMCVASLVVSLPFLLLLGLCGIAAILVGIVGWFVTVVPKVVWEKLKNHFNKE